MPRIIYSLYVQVERDDPPPATSMGYWLYRFVMQDGKTIYICMVRPAATVEDVRRAGRWMLRQGH